MGEILDQDEIKTNKNKLKEQAGKYIDKFRGDNMGAVRHLIKRPILLQSAQYEADLRHYHPDRIKPEAQTDKDKK